MGESVLTMVSVYCILNVFSLLIFANFAFCDDSKNSSVSPEMTDKMLPDEDHLIAEHCLKRTRSKYYQRNTKYCEMCSEADVDMVKEFPGLCKSCVKKKFRENNSFYQDCPPIVVETTFDKVKGGEKFKKEEKKDKKKKYKKPMKKHTAARTTTTIRPLSSTTTTVELGPFGKILRDLIHANTFIDK